MKRQVLLSLLLIFIAITGKSQFNYSIQLNPISIQGLPGLHSYAHAQHNGKWLIIGGRLDGLHARQPFNAFPESQNNKNIFVVDVANQQVWSANINGLSQGLQEQLQSTNMNFFQDVDTLFLIGGYGFSTSANNHITFPNLTSIRVPDLINAIIAGSSITSYFKQISDPIFQITGGQMGKIGNTLLLVGGHNFNGRYNPMGNPTYTQSYSNQIRQFVIHNNGPSLSFTNYSTITDPVHLHRRDFNLLPQIFPDGSQGYTISAGVFQTNVNLPYLYPININANGHYPEPGFNQYLSHYHSAKTALYDSSKNEMYSIFFGGMSQYYYQNGTLIQDNQVPFVKTISLLTRKSDSSLVESKFNLEMPNFKGASAEFLPNMSIPHFQDEIINLAAISPDTISIGHLFGGILSNSLNPFSNNQTNYTSADPSIYEVVLIKDNQTSLTELNSNFNELISIFPNPTKHKFTAEFYSKTASSGTYYIYNDIGQFLQRGNIEVVGGINKIPIQLDSTTKAKQLIFTLVIDGKVISASKVILVN